jgi:hypothetical protein
LSFKILQPNPKFALVKRCHCMEFVVTYEKYNIICLFRVVVFPELTQEKHLDTLSHLKL